ncbi:MAG TPA: efflux RND transporter periplasmic adaptor subunit [Candidatus Acidoferrales bacterium]|nr:efflux RND transporter periplasmic adaptor subunit [Candidatus Acidoferrales bacterium]
MIIEQAVDSLRSAAGRRRLSLALAAIAAVFSAACSRVGRVADVDAAQVPTVAVAAVTRGSLVKSLDLPAEFRPYQEIDLHAKVAGYVKKINVDVGDHVRTGQLLAVLEIPELQDEVTQAQSQVKRDEHEVVRAQADLDRSKASYQVAHLACQRLSDVAKTRPDLIAQQDLDNATGRDREAQAQVATSQAALAAAEQQLAVAHAGLERTRTMFAYAEIRAPFDGVITKRYADTGAMLAAGTSSEKQAIPLVRLSQNGLLRLIAQVPESAVSLVHVGSPASITVPELNKKFTGKVTRFADMVSTETRTMDTEIDVPNPNYELVPGMYATISLQLDHKDSALTVPIEGVVLEGDSASALVVDPQGKIEARQVKTGLQTASRVEILSGLREGELVVVGGRAQLHAGEHVHPKTVSISSGAEQH